MTSTATRLAQERDEARAIARRLAADLRECGIYGVEALAAFDALPWAKDPPA